MLRRFLKARSWDLGEAHQMWANMLAFRASYNVDRILTDFDFTERDAFLNVYPHGLHQTDKQVGLHLGIVWPLSDPASSPGIPE